MKGLEGLKGRWTATTWLAVGMTLVAILLMVAPRTSTYHLLVETESVELRLSPTPAVTWRFEDAELFRALPGPTDGEDPPAGERFSGELQPLPGAALHVRRTGSGALRLRLQGDAEGAETARLVPDGGPPGVVRGRLEVVLDGVSEVVARRGTLVFPVAGAGQLGHEIALANRFGTSLLRSGTISWTERTLVGGGSYPAGSQDLGPGDVVRSSAETPFVGAILVDENAAMKAIFDVRAGDIEVRRAGTETLRLSTSWLAKVRSDPSLQFAWGLVGFLLGLQSLVQEQRGDAP